MLSGIRFVGQTEAASEIKKEKKKKKQERKARKQEKELAEARKQEADLSLSDTPTTPAAPADAAFDVQPTSAREDWMTAPREDTLGLPVHDKAESPPKAEAEPKWGLSGPRQAEEGGPAASSTACGVGDAGASWRMKALRRAQAQAAERGEDVAAVLAERWGSMQQLKQGLDQAAAAHPRAHMLSARERRMDEGSGPVRRRGQQRDDDKADYLEDVRSNRSKMQRPTQASSLSWRGREGQDSQTPASPRLRDDAAVGPRSDPHKREPRAVGQAMQHGVKPLQRQTSRDSSAERPVAARRESNAPAADSASGPAARRDASPRQSDSLAQLEVEKLPSEAVNHHDNGQLLTGPSSPSLRHAQEVMPPAKPAGGNFGAAAALKARLMGIKAGAAQPVQEQQAGRESVALPLVDQQGRAAPGAFGRERAGAGLQDKDGRKPHRLQRYGQQGQRERWFADDDVGTSLNDVVRQQRHEGAEDIDANLADNIARKKRFRENELDADAEYDVDGGLELYESRSKRGHQAKAARRERAAQVADARRITSALDRCQLCFSSAARRRNLTLAIGQSAYLALPSRGSLTEGHCLIVPSEHVASTRRVDEAVWTELRNFKKALLQMAMSQGREIVFMETAKDVEGMRSHAVVEAVPVPPRVYAKAPLHFRKAVDDSSQEWSQHHAKRLIDTRSRGLRGSIPPNFAYFNVEFGISAGYVHVLDDEQTFDVSFGRNIMIGLLGLPPEDMHRRAREEPTAILQKRAADFASAFAPFDWTQQLE